MRSSFVGNKIFAGRSLKKQSYYRMARLSGKAPGKFYPPKPHSDHTPMLKLTGVNGLIETQMKLEYELCSAPESGIPVIVAAAGSSLRMNGVNKQTVLLGGIPVLARTLLAFERSEQISKIILVTKTEDLFEVQMMAERYNIRKISDILCGGATRQHSVLKGLSRLNPAEDRVLIHDGARPLVTERIISEVAKALEHRTAVACAVKINDTVKIVDETGRVIQTPDRDSLAAVQTPQGVRVAEYRQAIEMAGDLGKFTDDMSIMEAAGFAVYTVPGDYCNLKITTPEDLAVAESYLSQDI